jgi:hypothetical protein
VGEGRVQSSVDPPRPKAPITLQGALA